MLWSCMSETSEKKIKGHHKMPFMLMTCIPYLYTVLNCYDS